MRNLIIGLLLTQGAFATCFMQRTVCSSSVNFQNIYEYAKVSCSPPGGPVHTTEHLTISNALNGKKPLVSKKFNMTRDNYFQAKIETTGKFPTITIDDRSLSTESNINISTAFKPFSLYGYKCKHGYN
jgi:hypothetical protein